MNERIRELYQLAHEPQPPTRGTGTLTKDILWEQPDKFNPEKFAELLIKECADYVQFYYKDHACEVIAHDMKTHFGVEE